MMNDPLTRRQVHGIPDLTGFGEGWWEDGECAWRIGGVRGDSLNLSGLGGLGGCQRMGQRINGCAVAFTTVSKDRGGR
jgi:hypothetical protein